MVYLTKIFREMCGDFWLMVISLNPPFTQFSKCALKIATFFLLGVLLLSFGFTVPSVSMANVKESQTGKTSRTKKKVKRPQSPRKEKMNTTNEMTDTRFAWLDEPAVEHLIFLTIQQKQTNYHDNKTD